MSSFGVVVPPGTRFIPTDAELTGYYLYNKVTGRALPDGVVSECDLYGEENPWEIWRRYSEKVVEWGEGEDLYLFTRLKRKSPKAKRIARKVGIGRWEGEGGAEIRDESNGQCIGFMRRFRFEKSQTHQDGGWIMHEYSLNPDLFPPDFQMNDYVICRIRKNKRIINEEDLDQGNPKKLKRQIQFGEENQNGIEAEKNEVDSYLNLEEDENILDRPASPLLDILDGLDLHFGEDDLKCDDADNTNSRFDPFF